MNSFFAVFLFFVLLILLIPKPIQWTLQRVAPLILVGMFIVIGVVLFKTTTPMLTLTALDEKNEKSDATEVWLRSVIVNGEETLPGNLFSGEWIQEEGYLKWRAYAPDADSHRTLAAKLAGGESIRLVFDACKWRGRVRIESNEGSIVLDTYDANDHPRTKTITYDVSVSVGIKQFNSHHVLFLSILCLTLVAAFFMLFDTWKRKNQGLPASGNTKRAVDDREIWLDLLKVISAFFVVMIHAAGQGYKDTFGTELWTGFLVLNVLPRFSVPVFMMISGALMLGREVPIKKSLQKTEKALLLLLVWNMFYMILQHMLWGSSESIWRQLAAIPVVRQFSGHLWYLYFLVWMYLFTPVLGSLYRSMSREYRIYFVLMTLGIPGILDLYNSFFSFGGQTILGISQIYMIPGYAGLMVLGRLIYDEISSIRYAGIVGLGLIVLGFGGALILTAIYCNTRHVVAEPFISESKLFPVIYAAGIFVLAASRAAHIAQLNESAKWIIVFLSKRAVGIYAFHCAIQWLLQDITIGDIVFNRANSVPQALFCTILYYSITVYCVSAMSKIPFIREFVM